MRTSSSLRLTNAAKHANATRVMVEISATADTLSLRVRDDGVGGAKLDSSGAGLVGLADRGSTPAHRAQVLRSQRSLSATGRSYLLTI